MKRRLKNKKIQNNFCSHHLYPIPLNPKPTHPLLNGQLQSLASWLTHFLFASMWSRDTLWSSRVARLSTLEARAAIKSPQWISNMPSFCTCNQHNKDAKTYGPHRDSIPHRWCLSSGVIRGRNLLIILPTPKQHHSQIQKLKDKKIIEETLR